MLEGIRGTTLCAELVGGIMLVVHSPDVPSNAEWSAYCTYAGKMREAAGGTLRTLVFTGADSGPNASQRAEYKEKVAGKGNRIAVLCEGAVTRAIITAMSWFNPDMKAFGLGDVSSALSYLEGQDTPELRHRVERFQVHLGMVRHFTA